MKIIVFSDSHGLTDAMQKTVISERPDAVIHCGDYAKDAEYLRNKNSGLPVYYVSGNCDYIGRCDEEMEFVLCGKKFFITHGHRYGVKRDYQSLAYAGAERGADIVVCGHTHIPLFEEYENMYIINPGSITFGRKTYGLIELDGENFHYTLKRLAE